MKYYALTRRDGGVEIMQVVDGYTVKGCLAQWHPKRRAEIVSMRQISPKDIPQDRTHRNAWRDDGQHIHCDEEKCRHIDAERADRRRRRDKLQDLLKGD